MFVGMGCRGLGTVEATGGSVGRSEEQKGASEARGVTFVG